MKMTLPLAAALMALTVTAAAPASAYTVKGMGDCKGWVGGEDDRFWLLGFISGYNYAKNSNVGRNIESDDIYKFVSRFCKERPSADLGDAATAFITTQ